MTFPLVPTCHGNDPRFAKTGSPAVEWRPPDPALRPFVGPTFRTCSYCGSMHPEDLLRLLMFDKVLLGGSDWKYGWPHKFYVYAPPDPVAVENMKALAPGRRALGASIGKWYNDHILDAGFDADTFGNFLATLHHHSKIRFMIDDGQLVYSAPFVGFQH